MSTIPHPCQCYQDSHNDSGHEDERRTTIPSTPDSADPSFPSLASSTIEPDKPMICLARAALCVVPALTLRYSDTEHPMLEHLVGFEPTYMLMPVLAWLLRGATVADIERFAATGDGELPSDGVETDISRVLLAALAERMGGRAEVARAIATTADMFDNLLTMLEAEADMTRASIYQLLSRESYNA